MDAIRQLFDELGDGEWDRFDKDALSRVSLELHRRFLRRHVPEGAQVLEIGAGPVDPCCQLLCSLQRRRRASQPTSPGTSRWRSSATVLRPTYDHLSGSTPLSVSPPAASITTSASGTASMSAAE